MKLCPQRDKIIFISRQFDYPNLDFLLMQEYIAKAHSEIQMVFLCKKLRNGIGEKCKYMIYMFKCMCHLATAKYCVVDTYVIPVSILRHKKSLKIVQIWHALGAIKKFGYQTIGKYAGHPAVIASAMNMHKNYTYVLAPGALTAGYYREAFHVSPDNIKIMGMPRIDYILRRDDAKREYIYNQYPAMRKKPSILYVPTFRKDQVNNMDTILSQFDFNRYNLVIKYHPLDKTKRNRQIPIHRKAIAVYQPDISIYDLYKVCDAVITDYSSASLEACLLDKPVYFYVYDIDQYRDDPGLNMDPAIEMPSCTSSNFIDIMNWIEAGDYDRDVIRLYKERFFDIELDGGCTAKLVNFILYGRDNSEDTAKDKERHRATV